MKKVPVLLLCSCLLFLTVSCKTGNSLKELDQKSLLPEKVELDLDYSDSIVLIIDSNACSCVYEASMSLEKKLKQLYCASELKTKSKGVMVIDYRVKKNKAERLMDKYSMYPVPVVFVFDSAGRSVYSSSKEFDEKEFMTALNY